MFETAFSLVTKKERLPPVVFGLRRCPVATLPDVII
jgi:hypothetical protein